MKVYAEQSEMQRLEAIENRKKEELVNKIIYKQERRKL